MIDRRKAKETMSDPGRKEIDYERLQELAQLRERPFISNAPVVGPLIVRFRSAWNGVSTRWYVRPMADQQSTFNQLLIEALRRLESRLDEIAGLVSELDLRLVEQDRDQARLTHDLGELAAEIIQMRRALQAVEAQPSPEQDNRQV